MELLELWWFIWRWRKKKMKVESWRGWSVVVVEEMKEELVEVKVLVKRKKRKMK